MVLIITRSGDVLADVVISRLKSRATECLRIDTDCPTAQSMRTVSLNDVSSAATYESADGRVSLDQVSVVWNRRIERPSYPASLSPEDQRFAYYEYRHFTLGLWLLLRNKFWVNKLQATEAAEVKPYQLQVAQSVGFSIPRTLMTNDPSNALSFFDECAGRIIYKTFRPAHRQDSAGRVYGIYTSPVTRDTLLQCQDSIRLTPCLFQERINKKLDLRITVIGTRIFAVAIDAQRSERANLDWRRYDWTKTTYTPYDLPPTLIHLIQELMRRLDLVFGCIDMALTFDNEAVFFEINCMGEWLWLEKYASSPMLPCFIEMLVQKSPRYTMQEGEPTRF